jgi:hypothetical protein
MADKKKRLASTREKGEKNAKADKTRAKGAVKLAEALLLRADMQKKIASLRERIVANAVVPSEPASDSRTARAPSAG